VAAAIELLLASFDLAAVRAVTGAMQRADLHAAVNGAASAGAGAGIIERRFRTQPETHILPRRVIHPEPRIEPRDTFHPRPREAALPGIPEPESPLPRMCIASPVKPVWKTLPDVQHISLQPKVKIVVLHSDTKCMGTMIDVFM